MKAHCAVCGSPIGKLDSHSNNSPMVCSRKCAKARSHWGKYYSNEELSYAPGYPPSPQKSPGDHVYHMPRGQGEHTSSADIIAAG